MNKMLKKRKRRKLSKLLTSLPEIKIRKPNAPPTKKHKSKKDYNRKSNNIDLE